LAGFLYRYPYQDSNKTILVDPGINKDLLLQALAKEKLTPKDIDIVFLTHFHIDHVFLVAIFEDATVIDGETIYQKDLETEYEHFIPNTHLQVIPTPGHAHEHASLLFDTNQGKVVIAADLFWWTDNQKQVVHSTRQLINRKDPFTKDYDALVTSRKKVLHIADWIIPGHGKIFKNPAK